MTRDLGHPLTLLGMSHSGGRNGNAFLGLLGKRYWKIIILERNNSNRFAHTLAAWLESQIVCGKTQLHTLTLEIYKAPAVMASIMSSHPIVPAIIDLAQYGNAVLNLDLDVVVASFEQELLKWMDILWAPPTVPPNWRVKGFSMSHESHMMFRIFDDRERTGNVRQDLRLLSISSASSSPGVLFSHPVGCASWHLMYALIVHT